MKTVILTSGPQGAGKSTFCQQVVAESLGTSLVSRDDYLLEKYGTTVFYTYCFSPTDIHKDLFKIIKKELSQKDTIIFDCWNGYSFERKFLIKEMRELNVDKIVCWKFLTPLNLCKKWYFEREKSNYWKPNYFTYHRLSQNIKEDGFDSIRYINPLQLTFPGFPKI